ncbi:hypothetical protein X801_08746, partial [Opisthorchis viverrini]
FVKHSFTTDYPPSPEWPVCPLKSSVRLLLVSAVCIDLIGHLTYTVHAVLRITRPPGWIYAPDMNYCILLMVEQVTRDCTTWHVTLLCGQTFCRFELLKSPTMSEKWTLLLIIVMLIASCGVAVLLDCFVLLPKMVVCRIQNHRVHQLDTFHLVYSFIIPVTVVFSSLSGILCKLMRFAYRTKDDSPVDDCEVTNAKLTATTGTIYLLCFITAKTYLLVHSKQLMITEDAVCIALDLCLQIASCTRSYIFLLGGKSSRNDLKRILLNLSQKCRSRRETLHQKGPMIRKNSFRTHKK